MKKSYRGEFISPINFFVLGNKRQRRLGWRPTSDSQALCLYPSWILWNKPKVRGHINSLYILFSPSIWLKNLPLLIFVAGGRLLPVGSHFPSYFRAYFFNSGVFSFFFLIIFFRIFVFPCTFYANALVGLNYFTSRWACSILQALTINLDKSFHRW